MSALAEEELVEIVEVVWMTILNLEAEAGGGADSLTSTESVTAEIQISGAWEGSVIVEASPACLTHAASVMFNINEDDVKHMDCVDTLTELTNMLGGTVKCLLPEVCDLSLPTIQTNEKREIEHSEWVYFHCNGHPFAVTVLPQEELQKIGAAA